MTDVLTLAHCNCSVGLRTYDAFYIQECIHEINIHLRTDKKTEYRLSFQVGASAVGQGKTFKDPVYLPLTLVTQDNVADFEGWK